MGREDRMSFKRILKELSKDEIILLIEELSRLRKENKEFIELRLNKNIKKAVEYYKNKINLAFSEKTFSLKNARQAINDFRKLSKDEIYLI